MNRIPRRYRVLLALLAIGSVGGVGYLEYSLRFHGFGDRGKTLRKIVHRYHSATVDYRVNIYQAMNDFQDDLMREGEFELRTINPMDRQYLGGVRFAETEARYQILESRVIRRGETGWNIPFDLLGRRKVARSYYDKSLGFACGFHPYYEVRSVFQPENFALIGPYCGYTQISYNGHKQHLVNVPGNERIQRVETAIRQMEMPHLEYIVSVTASEEDVKDHWREFENDLENPGAGCEGCVLFIDEDSVIYRARWLEDRGTQNEAHKRYVEGNGLFIDEVLNRGETPNYYMDKSGIIRRIED